MYWIDYGLFSGENYAILLCNDKVICYGTIAGIKSILELLSWYGEKTQ